jgi:hypothetical protein
MLSETEEAILLKHLWRQGVFLFTADKTQVSTRTRLDDIFAPNATWPEW